ncbi:unnamed protein product [Rangifer tarandus platyrhynchus]|uniref:Uncharacterized protein n=1 Tax=Rangifer tarandus platyrhynchus TaxID=3082113 RepID=A0AC59ZYU5_RANTA
MCRSPGPQLCAAASPRPVCAPRQHGPGAGLLPQECSGLLGMPRRCQGEGGQGSQGWEAQGALGGQGQRDSSPAPGTGQLDAAHRQEVSSPIILSTPSLLHLCVYLSVGRKSRERTPSTPKEIREPSILHTPPRCPQGITTELFPRVLYVSGP